MCVCDRDVGEGGGVGGWWSCLQRWAQEGDKAGTTSAEMSQMSEIHDCGAAAEGGVGRAEEAAGG